MGLIAYLRGPQGLPGPSGPGMSWAWKQKLVAQSVISSTTFVNDLDLFVPVGALQSWVFDVYIVADGLTGADIKCSMVAPTGATGAWSALPQYAAGGGFQKTNALGYGCPVSFALQGVGTASALFMKGYLNTVAGGNLTLQWAQNTSKPTPTIVHMGYVLAQRTV